MKNMKLPNNDEWKKIVDDAFSSDGFHVFSENYNMKKHSMQSIRKGITMKKNNLIMNLTVAAAALTVVAVPTTLFISSQTSDSKIATLIEEPNSSEEAISESTQATAVINNNETEVTITDSEDDGQVNEETYQFTENDTDYDTIYNVEYGWLPEGLEFQEQDSPYGEKFHDRNTDNGMTPMFMKIPKGVTYTENINFVTSNDTWLLDGKTVSMNYRDSYNPDNTEYNFGRIAVIYFDNTPYVLKLYITDGISEEDFRKIIDNVKLVPSEKETAEIYTPPKNEQENIEFTVGSYDKLGVNTEDSVIAQIGEEVYETNPDIWGDVSAKINDVHFTDNFDGIKTDGIGWDTDYSEYLNENGTLIENTRKWIKYYNDENGAIQIEEIGTETVPVSVMTVNITYTNNGTTPVDDYCVCPTLQTMYDGYFFMPHIYNTIQMSMREAMNNIDYNDTFHFLETDDMHFSFSCSNQSGKNNINIAPGESVEVTLAFIVEDGLRDNIYLSMNDNGFVDLSNI